MEKTTCGIKYIFDGKEISNSELIYPEELVTLNTSINEDYVPVAIKCAKCGKYMEFKKHYTFWECNECKITLSSKVVYEKMKKENSKHYNI